MMEHPGRFSFHEIAEMTMPQVSIVLNDWKVPQANRREFANAREVAAYIRETANPTPKSPEA